ncbi:GtrA family protein [Demequina lignilytica]|uniref:GtrA family protein n=1 Tax=Demequina lignilytica TaxID=3051663 RepID=A0AAW7M9F1_9MICO|nr:MULTISPECIES: GtrA family protein [unclassified Demequina]MDN4478259.1 GtrA family protein [Demequina sp. SYSU T00039-1]MDN4482665.1 GtrA family protein [Demequina sp. SYSU T0a273]MDN4488291.1 GtrA family protein [Demequina sp. SYSU T00039]MDN4490162.1 GtrA family protein [Demequina sp. SYSU T00068]
MTITGWVRRRAGELTRFSVVGVAGVVVNLGVFNLLRLGPLAPDSTVAGDDDRVVTAKVVATLVSILFAWVAHRGWTFRGRRRHRPARELVLFGLVNAAALAVEAGAVAVSHHWWGLTSLWADNVASVIGIGLGTITRYAGYSLFVFADADDAARTGQASDAS